MEQKRILWIAAAVGIFLVVVIGAALVLGTAPKNDPTVATLSQTADTWAKPVQTPEQVTELNVRAATANVYSESVTTFTLNPAGNEITTVTEPTAPPQNAPQTGTAPLQIVVPAAPLTPAIAVTPPKQPTAAPAQATPAPTPAVVKTPPPAPKVTVTEYWIQAAALTEKKFAEQAREQLAQSKISSEIFTLQKDGKIYYRVRVGPYKTKTEAEYWLGLVKENSAFAASYITEVKTQR